MTLWALPAGAQEAARPLGFFDYDTSYYANPHYEQMTRAALDDRPERFNFGAYRNFYVKTRQYQPIADRLKREILDLAYKIETGADAEAVKQAQHDYDLLVFNHLANIGVVMQARSLSLQDPRFGNTEFLTWMEQGLVGSVIKSGTGRNMREAYSVITMEEESLLLRYRNAILLSREVIDGGLMLYNYNEVQDTQNGEKYAIVVDVSYPAAKLRKEEESKAFKVDIGKQ